MDVQFVSDTVEGLFLLCIVIVIVVDVIVIVTHNSMRIWFQRRLTIIPIVISRQFVINIIVQVMTMRLLLKMRWYNLWA